MIGAMWAMNMQMFVRPWFAFQLEGQAWLIGTTALAQGVPTLFLSLYGGALADRFNNKVMLIFGYTISTLATLAIAVLIQTDIIVWWHLILSAGVGGVGLAMAMGARLAIISELVPPGEVLNGVSLSNIANNVARIASPAIAGFLLSGALGPSGVFYLMSCMSGLSVVLFFLLPSGRRRSRNTSQSVLKDMEDGFRFVRQHDVVIWLILMYMVTATLGMPYLFLLPVLADTAWSATPEQIGLIFSMVGIGSLVGSFSTASMGSTGRMGLMLIIVCIGFGVGIVALAISPLYWIALIVAVPLGTCQSARLSLNPALVQLQAPDHIRSRVMGIYEFSNGIFPIGVLLMSITMVYVDPRMVMAAAGTLMAIFSFYVLFAKPTVRQL